MNKALLLLFLPLSSVLAATMFMGSGSDGELKLLASDGRPGDEFGTAIAVSGQMVVVGAEFDDNINAFNVGTAYVFDLASGAELHKLDPLEGNNFDGFGASVDINGNTAIIGVRKDDDLGTNSGSAFLFDVVTGLQIAKLLPGDGADSDQFGTSVAIDGGLAVVGAPLDDDNGSESGSAYVFDSSSGLELLKLLPIDGEAFDEFGHSVATDGQLIVIGARQDDDNGSHSGSAYIFDACSGQQLAKLVPDDRTPFAFFGSAVALDNGLVVVGAPGLESYKGGAFLFDATTQRQLQEFTPDELNNWDAFGTSVAISGTLLFVGAPSHNAGANAGAAFVFDLTSGQAAGVLASSDGAIADNFGVALAVEGSKLLVGAKLDDDNSTSSGSAYVLDLVLASAIVRNGSGLNASILTTSTVPKLSLDWVANLDAFGHAASLAAMVIYSLPSQGAFLAGGELLVDLTSPQITSAQHEHSGGSVLFVIPVPGDTALCGLQASAQGIVFGAPAYELSNAIDLVVGF